MIGFYISLGILSVLALYLFIKNRGLHAHKIDVQTFVQKLNSLAIKDRTLLDVRTSYEYKLGHIPHARNLDISSGALQRQLSQLDKDKPIFVYCKSGMRSGNASNILKKEGFSEIYDLKGGYDAYSITFKK